jgi:hypothetical protein
MVQEGTMVCMKLAEMTVYGMLQHLTWSTTALSAM